MNIETKIEELRKEFNSKLDDILKPKFEVGWLKLKEHNVFCYTTDFKKGYGISHGDEWTDVIFIDDLNYWKQTTPKEVEEELIKEAEKRGFKEGVDIKHDGLINEYGNMAVAGERRINSLNFYYENNVLRLSEHIIYSNGKWAEIVKNKTIDEIASELNETFGRIEIEKYLTENKQDIINALNNL